MERQNLGLGAIVLALLTGFVVGFPLAVGNLPTSSSTKSELPRGVARSVEKHGLPEHSGADLIMDFVGGDPDQIPTGQIWSQTTHWTPEALSLDWSQTTPWTLEALSLDKEYSFKKYSLKTIIATLPDPIAPALREKFDDRIDAISRAAEEDNYILDRIDMPWPKPGAADRSIRLGDEIDLQWRTNSQDTSAGPYFSAKPRDESLERYLHDPGLMLFRSRNTYADKPELLLVFVIGERPTTGVHKFAMRSALDQVAWLCRWYPPPNPNSAAVANAPPDKPKVDSPFDQLRKVVKCDQDKLLMLAPSASGAATSIDLTLRAWHKGLNGNPKVRIVSGSAAGIKGFTDSWIEYSSAMVPVTAAVFRGYLRNQFGSANTDLGKIAILSEESTAYGQAVSHPDDAQQPPPSPPPGAASKQTNVQANPPLHGETILALNVEAAKQPNLLAKLVAGVLALSNRLAGKQPNQSAKSPVTAEADDVPILMLKFPLYISDVRRAAGRKTSNFQAPTRSDIQLPAEESAQTDYIAPHYSPRSVASDQIVLENLLSTIHQERVRYIGIVGSDVEDRIFLVQQIRDSCPDTTIFLFNSDLFYLHSDFNFDLRGTIVLSTYPLFAMNQLWTYPFDGNEERWQFPNDFAEGVFNATLALLNDDKRHYDDDDKRNYDELRDYSAPFVKIPGRPVLWASVVGKDKLWPLSFSADPSANAPNIVRGKLEPEPERLNLITRGLYSGSFIITFLAASVIAGLWSILLLARFPLGPKNRAARMLALVWSAQSPWLELIIGSPSPRRGKLNDQDLRMQRRSFLSGIGIGILALYLVIATFFLMPFRCALGGSFSGTIRWLLLSYNPSSWLAYLGIIICVSVTTLCFCAVFSLLLRYDHLMRPLYAPALRNRRETIVLVPPWHIRLLSGGASPTSSSLNSLIFALLGIFYCLSIAVPVRWCMEHNVFRWLFSGLFSVNWRYGSAESLYLFFRATTLGDGVSPIVPVVWVGGAAISLLVCSLRRVAIATANSTPKGSLAFTGRFASFAGVAWQESRVRQILRTRPGNLDGAKVVLVVGVLWSLSLLYMRPNRSLDGSFFDCFVLFGAFAVFVAVGWALLRMVSAWHALRELLRRLYRHPGRDAYKNYFSELPGRQRITLTETIFPLTAIESSLAHARQLIRIASTPQALPKELGARLLRLKPQLIEAEQFLTATLRADADGRMKEAVRFKAQTKKAVDILSEGIVELLERNWRESDSDTRPRERPAERLVAKHAELFLASRVVDFLREIFPHFGNLMTFVTVAILMTLLALSSYPFAQRDTLLVIAWLTVLAAVTAVGYVLITMNRDRVLSLLSGSTPGQITWNANFVGQLLIYGILPLLGLIGVQFPGHFGSFLSSFSKSAPGPPG